MISAAHLDMRQREREIRSLSLPDLLLTTGAMSGPHRRARPATIGLLKRLHRALAAHLQQRAPTL